MADLASANHRATLAGALALVASIVTLVRLRRHRRFRNVPLVLGHAGALVVAAAAFAIGALAWLGMGSLDFRYTTMPQREQLGGSSHVQRVLDATVVVLATGSDGDARELALGTGAVIARDGERAWVVTCSHVAMPYIAVGAFRSASAAQPVWAQLSDGRQGRAYVRWTAPPPVDVVLLELPMENAPDPVPIAPDSSAMQPDAPVMFVPNPYRAGWIVKRGTILRREPHRTPAGLYDLLFTDLNVIPGDSGSGLYDDAGQLVGINTWTRTGAGPAQGISLPAETMRGLVDAIHSGRLGKER
jgi:S1-C subfamily serine protease